MFKKPLLFCYQAGRGHTLTHPFLELERINKGFKTTLAVNVIIVIWEILNGLNWAAQERGR